MKLKEIKEVLDAQLPKLKLYVGKANYQNKEYYSIQGLPKLRLAILAIEQTGLFDGIIREIRETSIFKVGEDQVLIEHAAMVKLQELLNRFAEVANSVRDALEKLVGESNEHSIFIKLPQVRDFKDLAHASSTFQTILSQSIVNDEINGQIKITSVENGSIWLNVYVGSAAAVSLLGGLAWAAAVVYKKAQEGRYLAETVRTKKIQNNNKVDIGETYKLILGMMVEAEATHLHSENFKTDSPEQIERLKHCIKLLSEEMGKGAEVHPSLTAPENVVNLFPNMKNITGIESKIKRLTEGGTDSNESAA